MIRKQFDRLRHITVFRYLFVGGTSYVFELSSLLLIFHFSESRTLAAAISFWVGFLLAFALQKIVAFKDYRAEGKVVARQTTLYVLLNGWNYLFTVGFVSLFPDDYLIVSRTVALVMMSAWNFVIYKKYIFKDNVTTPV
jgi:putative flippase GtrA